MIKLLSDPHFLFRDMKSSRRYVLEAFFCIIWTSVGRSVVGRSVGRSVVGRSVGRRSVGRSVIGRSVGQLSVGGLRRARHAPAVSSAQARFPTTRLNLHSKSASQMLPTGAAYGFADAPMLASHTLVIGKVYAIAKVATLPLCPA